jgi:hypothetical protein
MSLSSPDCFFPLGFYHVSVWRNRILKGGQALLGGAKEPGTVVLALLSPVNRALGGSADDTEFADFSF